MVEEASPARPPSRPAPAAAAIRRSLDLYYRDRARTARMDALNAQFVGKGSLAFDIGAHVGDRTGSFLRLGARVVAAEPQPAIFRALRLIHGRNRQVTLLQAGVGERPAMLAMHINTRNPTVSTLSSAFIDAARGAPGWQGEAWDGLATVPVTTLDALVEEHGRPDFVKIDVEGHEGAVLAGLSVALPALSFEFTTIQRSIAQACIDRLEALGDYVFNLSLGEDHRLGHAHWLAAASLRQEIAGLSHAANSGDIFARLKD